MIEKKEVSAVVSNADGKSDQQKDEEASKPKLDESAQS